MSKYLFRFRLILPTYLTVSLLSYQAAASSGPNSAAELKLKIIFVPSGPPAGLEVFTVAAAVVDMALYRKIHNVENTQNYSTLPVPVRGQAGSTWRWSDED